MKRQCLILIIDNWCKKTGMQIRGIQPTIYEFVFCRTDYLICVVDYSAGLHSCFLLHSSTVAIYVQPTVCVWYTLRTTEISDPRILFIYPKRMDIINCMYTIPFTCHWLFNSPFSISTFPCYTFTPILHKSYNILLTGKALSYLKTHVHTLN